MSHKKKLKKLFVLILQEKKVQLLIYKGQLAIIKNQLFSEEIKEMLKKEEEHFKKFSELLIKYRVRPTILDPIWEKGAFGLGLFSGALGKKATMACTEAVEEVIIDHYQNQAKYLKGKDAALEKITRKFADDEKDHMHQAKSYDTGNDIFSQLFQVKGVKIFQNLLLN